MKVQRTRGRRIGVVAGAALAMTAMTATAAMAAGPPMPDFEGKPLMNVFKTVDYRTRVDVRDASGFNRYVLWPGSWKVCEQTPKAGVELNGQTVLIGVVKKTEPCPK
ncbi:hypothetical protein [Streptomyces sp. NBC_01304]|uniref:hypothetical protein n=1 Tax=Streptomyces sp. NBC_01304 TaxID=2903818 RepID=UPI002E133249|nr:hypothetical protein OG430_10535 [Streptomyces sp. NBC_01304]